MCLENSITTYPVRCFLTFFNNDREFQTCLMLQTDDVTFDVPNVPNTSSGSAFGAFALGFPWQMTRAMVTTEGFEERRQRFCIEK
jgi:hypothetical protein